MEKLQKTSNYINLINSNQSTSYRKINIEWKGILNLFVGSYGCYNIVRQVQLLTSVHKLFGKEELATDSAYDLCRGK